MRIAIATILVFLFSLIPAKAEELFWNPVFTDVESFFPVITGERHPVIIPSTELSLKFRNTDGTWIDAELPDNECLRKLAYRHHKTFWFFCVDNNFDTHFYSSKDARNWEQPIPSATVPVRFPVRIDEKRLLFAGDHGTLILVDQDGHEMITPPTRAHVMAVGWHNGELYLSMRGEGVFKVDTTTWEFLKIPVEMSQISDVIAFNELPDGSFVTFHNDGTMFRFNENRFVSERVSVPDDIAIFRQARSLSDGIYWIGKSNVWKFDGYRFLPIPLPAKTEMLGMYTSPNDCTLLQDEMGRMWRLEEADSFRLVEAATVLDLSFMPSARNIRYTRAKLKPNEDYHHILWDSERSNQVRVYRSDEFGRFFDISELIFTEPLNRIDELYAFDFSGNGLAELVTVQHRPEATELVFYRFLFQRLRPYHSVQIPSDLYSRMNFLGAEDINQNGKLDLVLGFYYSSNLQVGEAFWIPNRRQGAFQFSEKQTLLFTQSWITDLSFADFNGDGNLDLYLANYWRPDKIIYDIRSNSPDSNRIYVFPEINNTEFVVSADISGNNLPDIIRYSGVNSIEFFLNNGSHDIKHDEFSFAHISTGPDVQGITLADLNGNNRKDLVISYNRKNKMNGRVFLNDENGFEDAQDFIAMDLLQNGQWVVWDYNGNQRPDLLVLGSAYLAVLKNYAGKPVESQKNIVSHGSQIVFSDAKKFHHAITFRIHARYLMEQWWFYGYILLILTGHIIILFGLRYGSRQYRWSFDTSTLLLVVNSVLFWALLFLTRNNATAIHIGLPLMASLVGIGLPLILNLGASSKSKEEYQEELVALLLRFSHGAWGNSLINRLEMLLKNVSATGSANIKTQISERLRDFQRTLLPETAKLAYLAEKSGIAGRLVSDLQDCTTYLETINPNSFWDNRAEILVQVANIRIAIRTIRLQIWKMFTTDLRDAVREQADLAEELCRETGISLVKEQEEVHADYPALIPRPLLMQVLDNTINNAAKAVEHTDSPEIKITLYKKAPRLYISVKDNGMGIAQADLTRIFNQGFSTFGSSGLGLTSAKEMLSKFGGGITVHSEGKKKGTTVTIELLEGSL